MDLKIYKNFMGNFWFLKLKETLNSYNFPWYKGPILEENEKIQTVG